MKLAFPRVLRHHAEVCANSNTGMRGLADQESRRQPGCVVAPSRSVNPRAIPEESPDASGINPRKSPTAPGIDPRTPGDSSGISFAKSFKSGDHKKNGLFCPTGAFTFGSSRKRSATGERLNGMRIPLQAFAHEISEG